MMRARSTNASPPRAVGAAQLPPLLLPLLLCCAAGHAADGVRPLDPALTAYRPQAVAVAADASYLAPDGAVKINGAEHVQYIVERFNAQFSATHPGVRFVVDGKGTTSAVPLLMHGKTLFGAMGRAINPIEAVPYRKIVGRDALEIRVARTADDTSGHLATSLAVYVNRANPLTQASAADVARMLSIGNPGGDYSTWGQLGLKGDWAQRSIHPYGTPEYTGFGDYLQQEHLNKRTLAPLHEQASNTEAILQRIGADPAGMGVAAIGMENPQVRQLAIVGADGRVTTGTAAEVSDGSYPYARWLYFYVRRLPGQPVDPLVREYLRLVLSRDGQAIIASQPKGYIPLTATQAAAELAKLD
ncbi:PstS family phosphate ABC transporter substrate-binding protein [Duganella aceris]|uniref:Phosphate-binding protein n=1 Tax=Duganella aceris TaxID=2703883 RepID=A0ABX0FJP9_9BURK|nr:substrate-binding domain-containing protein [Duganella aceris]NGZ84791.1 phosphate-binding protein [Duganella aceris]